MILRPEIGPLMHEEGSGVWGGSPAKSDGAPRPAIARFQPVDAGSALLDDCSHVLESVRRA